MFGIVDPFMKFGALVGIAITNFAVASHMLAKASDKSALSRASTSVLEGGLVLMFICSVIYVVWPHA